VHGTAESTREAKVLSRKKHSGAGSVGREMIKNKISNKCESQEYSCWKMQFKSCKALEQRKYSLQNCSSQFSRCFNEN